jgi:hypothetical protein
MLKQPEAAGEAAAMLRKKPAGLELVLLAHHGEDFSGFYVQRFE